LRVQELYPALLRLGGGRRRGAFPCSHSASVTITASNFAALQTLRDELGKQFRAGVVLYLGNRIVPFGDKLWLIPVPALWAP
jgi:hypothetical protein